MSSASLSVSFFHVMPALPPPLPDREKEALVAVTLYVGGHLCHEELQVQHLTGVLVRKVYLLITIVPYLYLTVRTRHDKQD